MFVNFENLNRDLPEHFKLDLTQHQLFTTYLNELLLWNRRIRLVSPTDEQKLVTRHIVESLALTENEFFPKKSGTVLDLGSGAGFPGLPIKIFKPSLKLILVDSKRMKALFLKNVVRKLNLNNIQVVGDRIENLQTTHANKCDCVIARAVSTLKKLWQWSHPLLNKNGWLLAQKGGDISDELEELRAGYPEVVIKEIKYNKASMVDPSRFIICVSR